MASVESTESAFGCAICANCFKVDEQTSVCTIPCGHVYHEQCLKQWFCTQIQQIRPSSCPKCRALTNDAQIIRLFLHEIVSYPDVPMEEEEQMTETSGDNAQIRRDCHDPPFDDEFDIALSQLRLS